jgi:predicted transposase/invertase (TIGR01784 family)
MIFLDPTSDLAFKKLFGNQAKKEILISFLNSVLEKKGDEIIVDVTITDPYNNPDTGWLKLSIVDVRCTDQYGRHLIVEVQVKYQDDYPERVQHYVAHAIARQLGKGGRYGEIMPVIFIGILNENLFESPEYLSHHNIRNITTQEHALKHMDFYFIELPKFNKELDQLSNITDKWIYLLKNAESLDAVPKQLQSPVEIEDAMDELKQGNLSPKELGAYDAYLDARRVAVSVENTLRKEGKEEGIREGEQKGRDTERLEIARQLLDVLDVETISQKTGLSSEEITKLKLK